MRWICIVSLFCVIIPSVRLSAQTIPDEPVCDSCVISLHHMFQLNSDGADEGRVSGYATVTSDGVLYFSTAQTGSEVKVYGSDGRYMADIADRKGEGPGEFEDVMYVLPTHGDLLVFDQGNARISVLSGSDYEYQTSWPAGFGVIIDAIRLDNGGLALNLDSRSLDGAGKAVHLYESGKGQPYAMVDEFSFTARTGLRPLRSLVVVPGGFLSIQRYEEYRIRAFTNSGFLAATYMRDAPWFDSEPGRRRSTPTVPPMSYVIGAYLQDGLLWVFIRHRDEEWPSSMEEIVREDTGETAYRVVDVLKYGDTIVEIIDVDEGRVVARARFDRHLVPVSHGIVVTGTYNDLGFYEMDIHSISVE